MEWDTADWDFAYRKLYHNDLNESSTEEEKKNYIK